LSTGLSERARESLPETVAKAAAEQPRAAAALGAALSSGPSHAYLFRGPHGSGKRAVARAFSAELLAAGADDPEGARRRALMNPSPHPDLVWLRPAGAQHMIDDVREQVIRASVYRPFEGRRRVFVIEAAEAMRDESQNSLLKTLEEPPAFAHLILLSSEPEALLETIASRCQSVEFQPLTAAAIESRLMGSSNTDAGCAIEPGGVAAAARLAAGDLERGTFLISERGRQMREQVRACMAAAVDGDLSRSPWKAILSGAEAVGEDAEAEAREVLQADADAAGRRSAKEVTDGARRAGRRRRTDVLDLGLALCAAWLRDVASVCAGAEEVVFNSDSLDELRRQAGEVRLSRVADAVALVAETRRGLDLNVSEELALETLFFRLEALLAAPMSCES